MINGKFVLVLLFIGGVVLGQNSKEAPDLIRRAFLYGQENVEGTARYRAMSGAMGALGGDLSAVGVNPAGGAVFLTSSAAVTLGMSTIREKLTFGTTWSNNRNNFSLNQGGLAIVFNNADTDVRFKNWVITANYTRSALLGSEIWLPKNPEMSLPHRKEYFGGYHDLSTGYTNKFNLTLSTNYQDKLYLGVGVNLFTLRRYNRVELYSYEKENPSTEPMIFSRDNRPYTEDGSGYSLNVGAIYKPIQAFRIGLAYHSPVWWREIRNVYVYNPIENGIIGLDKSAYFLYDLNTPGKFSLSGAYLLGKRGLLSVDYTYKIYTDTKLSGGTDPGKYSSENNYLNIFMRDASQLRVGGEYRLGQWRFRAGYRHEQSPFKSQRRMVIDGAGQEKTISYIPFGGLNGFSLGLGYQWGKFFADLSYDYAYNTKGFITDIEEYIKRYEPVKYQKLDKEYYSQVRQSQGNVLFTFGVYF